jgi:hypothetical protein
MADHDGGYKLLFSHARMLRTLEEIVFWITRA